MAVGLLVTLFTLPASAGFKDGVFTSAEHGVKFKLPKDWKLETVKGEDGRFAMFQNADGSLRGGFLHVKEGWTSAKHAKWRGAEWVKKCKTVTWDSEEKVGGGDREKVVFALEQAEGDFKVTHLFVANGKDNFELILRCPDAQADEAARIFDAVVASVELGEFKEEPGDEPASGTTPAAGVAWADGARGIGMRGAAGWKFRTGDFRVHDPNEILEWDTGDAELMVSLSEVDNAGDVDAKTWADLTVKALGKTFENQKMLEGVAPAGTERRDFRADNDGKGIRFAYLFLTRSGKEYYLQAMVPEEKWEGAKAAVESLLASIQVGDVASLVEEMKSNPAPKEPAANPPANDGGGKEVLLPNPWEGCGKGSWVKYAMVSEAAGTKTEMEMVMTLVDFDGDSYTQKTDMVMNGTKIPGQDQKVSRRQKAPEGGEAPKPEEGDETVKVAKGEYKCHWIKSKSDQGWSQIWTSDDVVLKTVKTVAEFGGGKSTMELVDFEKK
ncbi:MAG: hypothetical protein K8T20_06170 [Planctomycetes bacterium]|nr:hypothetical protein [Planctomycetota bacterium]